MLSVVLFLSFFALRCCMSLQWWCLQLVVVCCLILLLVICLVSCCRAAVANFINSTNTYIDNAQLKTPICNAYVFHRLDMPTIYGTKLTTMLKPLGTCAEAMGVLPSEDLGLLTGAPGHGGGVEELNLEPLC